MYLTFAFSFAFYHLNFNEDSIVWLRVDKCKIISEEKRPKLIEDILAFLNTDIPKRVLQQDNKLCLRKKNIQEITLQRE